MSKRVSPPTPDGGGNDLPQCFAGAIDRLMRSLPSTVKAEEEAFLKSFLRQADSLASADAISKALLDPIKVYMGPEPLPCNRTRQG